MSGATRKHTFGGNVGWGIKWGLAAAVFFSVWVTGVRLISGEAPFRDVGVTYAGTVVTYLLLGLVGGCVLGTLRPVAASRSGAILTGWVIAGVVYCGVSIAMGDPPWRWSGFQVVALLLISLLVGSVGGNVHWQRARSK